LEADKKERLFSYGTLQLEAVQEATFGRRLAGRQDALVGFRRESLRIQDPDVVRLSGKDVHVIVVHTGLPADQVEGAVFEVSMDEVLAADRYEVSDYRRVSVVLRSGTRAWVYVDKRHAPPGP
jgi:gamma-glutamylcyclotransferase (GGCT)/AIG2-like uncharacterized protein YtfP